MAPAATSAARRATAAPQARPGNRRPPLRIFEPEPRRTSRRSRSRRFHIWLAVALVAGSLLAVVVGDALVAQGQVRLASIQLKISAAEATQKAMRVEVAQLAAPNRIVVVATANGLTPPAKIIDVPQVPLDVALPGQQASAAPAPAAKAAPAPAPPAKAAPAPVAKTPAATPAAKPSQTAATPTTKAPSR